jgi:predicted metal-dependent peptidase
MLSIGKQLTAEQRLSKAIVDIMANSKYVALAGVLMIGKREVSDTCPTAATNGKNEVYGRAFVDSLNDAELRFLVLHENYHKLYRHLETWRWMYDINHGCANQACDFVINHKLVEDNADGFATMTGRLTIGCYDKKYAGMDAAQVFHLLRKNGGGKGNGKGQPGSGGKAGKGEGEGEGEGFDEHDWDGAESMTADEKRELAREVDEAIRQGALIAGKLGTGGDREFGELLQPQVDWREVLREFITSTCTGHDYSTWKRPNRRYVAGGYYMPSGVSEHVGALVIAPDTSGSTFAPGVLPAFLSEAQAICTVVKPEKAHIIYWDTQICGHEVYEQSEMDNMIHSTKPKGGGGTTVSVVGSYMKKEGITPQAVIVLTDGYLGNDWGTWDCPVLWCVIDNKSAIPPNGKVVHIKASDF